jgi:serine/threonine protein kinase/tetratricopeptide (TPR) repeat protein
MADPSPSTKLPLELLRQIDGLCSKYEAALRAGKRPDPAKLLEHLHHPAGKSAESPAQETSLLPRARRRLLCEVLLLELEFRAPTDHEAVIAEWMRRFPDCIDVIKAVGERAAARSGGSTRGTQGQGRTPSPDPCEPGSTATNAPPHGSEPLTARPQHLRTPKNPSATPGLAQTVDYSPRLGTEEPVTKTVPPLSRTQPPESGPGVISGSTGSSPNQHEGAAPMRSIGRFQLLSVVGQGSFGTVYRAHDPVLDREVALKVPKFLAREPEQIKRFLTEAKAAARLRHPNIVAVFEAGEADGIDYIVTEFVSGETLSRRLKRERPRFRQAAQWVRDLALALEYAHGEGVIHRDIKPDNIMIGDSQRPQLMDFGLAKVLAEAAPPDLQKPVTGAGYQASSATADGTIMGTPAYMAPEQARGDVKAVGPRADQYSLGVVLYELLTGQRPEIAKWAPASSPVGSEGFFVHVPYRPRQVNALIPPNLEAICLMAMAQEPTERYASAADLAVDLQRWLQDTNTRLVALSQEVDDFQGTNPVAARPPTLKERLIRSVEPPPPTADAAWLATDDHQDDMAEHEESRPRKVKKRKRKRKGAATAASGPLNTWTAAVMLLFTVLLVSSFTLSKMLGFSFAPPPFFDSQAEQEPERNIHEALVSPHEAEEQPTIGFNLPQPATEWRRRQEEAMAKARQNLIHLGPPSGMQRIGPIVNPPLENKTRQIQQQPRQADREAASLEQGKRLRQLTYYKRGASYAEKGEYDKAIADLTEAIQLDPKVAGAYNRRGFCYFAKHEYDKAIADCSEAIRLDPQDADNYSLRATAYQKKHEYNLALKDYAETIRIDAHNLDAHNAIAWLRATCPNNELRDGKTAVEHATKACELSQWKNGNCFDTLAAAYAEIGNFEEAIRWQKRALEVGLGPDVDAKEVEKARLKITQYQQGRPYRED